MDRNTQRNRRDSEKRYLRALRATIFTTYTSLEVFALLQGIYCLLVDGLLFDWVAVRAFGWGVAATVLYLLLESKESTLKDGLKSAWEFAFVLPASIVTLYCVFGIQVPASAS